MNNKFLSLLLASLALSSPPGEASTSHVSRCAGADGTAIYTDGSCRALGAQVTPMSAHLVRNLVREGALGLSQSMAMATVNRPDRRESSAAQCARTPGQLAAALKTSLSAGDVNDLAGIYDWHDMSGKQSRTVLKRLEQMSDRKLIDGRFFATGMGEAAGKPGESGVVQLVQGARTAPTVTELAVVRRSGCLLLAF